MTRGSLFLLAIPLAFAACSGDAFTSPDDGGSDTAVDAPVGDASTDARPDAPPPVDGSTGDAIAVDAGWQPPPPLVCAQAPADAVFCANFDNSTNAAQDWTATFTPSGTITSDTVISYSPGRSAKAVANAGSTTYAELYEQVVPAAHSHIVFSFAFRVTGTDTTAKVRIAELEYVAASGPFGKVDFGVILGSGTGVTLTISTPTPSVTEYNLGNYKVGTWHHVSLDVKVVSPVKVDANFDGSKQSFSPVCPAADTVSYKTRDIYVGARGVTTTASVATLNFDDVLLRAF